MSGSVSDVWDAAAERFDDEADHGLRDPSVRTAWTDLLTSVLPPPPAAVLDLGAGTGSLSVLLAEKGYRVTGLDVAPRMVAAARDKAVRHGVEAVFIVGDAARPPVDGDFDVVLCRHVLWAMPDPAAHAGRVARTASAWRSARTNRGPVGHGSWPAGVSRPGHGHRPR